MSMRILLANTRHFYGGGDSTYTFNLAALLQEKRHSVSFLAMKDARNLSDPNSDLFVSHIDFKELNLKKSIASGMKVLSRVIYSKEARNNFSRLLDRVHPDIIHLQNIHAHITPSVIFEANKRRLPVIWTLHDYKLICPNSHFLIDGKGIICEACKKGSYFQAVLRKCKKDSLLASAMAAIEAYVHRLMRIKEKVDLFLTPSDFLRSKLIEAGFSKKKAVHLPLFIPDKLFKSQGGDSGYLLFMARLEPIKGIYPLIEAGRKSPNVKVLLAGRADESIAHHLSEILPKNVEYVGFKSGDELRSLLLGAKAVVLPSLWYENQPFSIIEAFAAGKPVIASGIGGMSELVKHREHGLLVKPGDVKALSAAMNWMATNPDEAREMGQKAREYALREHRAEGHYQRLIKIYEYILAS